MSIEVLGLGAAAMDIVLDCEALPREDGFSVVYDEKLVPGGSCANVLVTLANLGQKTGLLAMMGERVKVVFDLEVEPDLMARCGIDKAQIEEMLSLCDLFVTFRGGMLRLTEASDAVAGAMDLYETWRPKMGVAVTLGGQGSAWIMNEGKVVVPAYPVTPVDTTGAGDAFVGGLIHACFFQGFSPGKSLEYANACGALKCTQSGPRWKGKEKDILNQIMERDLSKGLTECTKQI